MAVKSRLQPLYEGRWLFKLSVAIAKLPQVHLALFTPQIYLKGVLFYPTHCCSLDMN